MKQPQLRTKRLILRSFCLEDTNEVQKLAGNYNVSKMTLSIPYPYNCEMAEDWISSHQKNWDARTEVVYAMVEYESKQLLEQLA